MMKRRTWILSTLICLALICVCAWAAADGMVLKNEAGDVLNNGDFLTGKAYYKVYVSGLPEGCDAIYTGWTEDMEATQPDGWEEEPRQLDTENGQKVLHIIPDPFGGYEQEIMFARINDDDRNVRKIEIHYDRNEAASVRPRITTTDDPDMNQEYTLAWTGVAGAESYFIRWELPTGECRVLATDETSITLDEELTQYIGNYSAEVVPLINGFFGRRSSTSYLWVGAPQDGRVWVSADQLDESNGEIRIQLNEAVNYHISAPGADEVRFMNGEGYDSAIQPDNEGNTDYFWMPGREDWDGDRTYTVYAQARFGDEWVTSNTINVIVHIDGDVNGHIEWTIVNGPNIPRDGLAEIQVEPIPYEEVDFYCAYIAEGDRWIADSHWVDANADGATTILMPLVGCAPGDYDVHVFAVRFGSRSKESDYTVPITVGYAMSDNPITISMKNSFETGEPLWIRAWYGNPQNLDENNTWMHVTIRPADEDGNPTGDEWYSEGGGFDFWDGGYSIGWRGNYVLTAWIYENVEGQEDPQEVDGTRTTFTFEVRADDDLDEPNATITDHARRGENINLHFGKTQNAEHYGYWIHREEDRESLMNDGSDQPGDFGIDTGELEPGIYWVETDVMARGYQQGHRTLHFALADQDDTELSGENGSYYFFASAGQDDEGNINISTEDSVRFIYYVPGADQVKILNGNGTGDNEDQIEHAGGPGVKGWRSWDEPGEYVIYGSHESGGNWSDPVPLCTINVQGRLGEPDVDMPWVVNAGEDVTITFNGNEGATWYGYWLSDEGGNQDTGISGEINKAISKPTSRIIYDDQLSPNHVYRVYLDISADGYRGHSERILYVIGDDDTTGDIWLNINPDETQSINPVGVGETFEVEAHAENAQEIFIRRDDNGDIQGGNNGDYFRDTYCIDDPGSTASFTAFARVNDCELLVRRGQADVTGTDGAEYAAPPTLTIAQTTVARNSFLEATVSSSEAGAYEYHVNIFDSESGEWYGDYRSNQPGTIRIPTNNLPEGTYNVGAWVRVHGKYSGDTGHDAAHQHGWQTVTITECENRFYCSTDTVQVFEPMTVSICAPGAERIRFSGGYDRWYEDDGWDCDNWYSDDVRWDYHADTTWIKAEAMYNGRWEPIGSRRITITAAGDLTQPDLSGIDHTVPAGENHIFSFDAVQNAERYEIQTCRLSDGQWRYTEINASDVQGNTVSFRLNGEGEGDFLHNPNEGYAVYVTVKGTGYNANGNETTFVTGPAETAGHEIVLEADRNDAQSNRDNVHFTVTAEGASIIAIYHEGQWNWAPADENGQAEFDLCFNQDTLQPVWARACYNPDYTGWDWEAFDNAGIDASDLTYEGISNIVNIDVYSDGETMMPDWAYVPEEVAWGELLQVEIGGEGNAETLHIRIRSDEENEIFFKEIHERGSTIYLPTVMLTPGEDYWVSIDGVCSGYTWNHLNGPDGDFQFTVIARQGTEPFMTSDRDEDGWVFVNEPYYVQMYAPGAVELMAAVEADPEYDVNAKWDGDTGVSNRNGFWWEEAGRKTLNGYARYTEGGAWEPIGSVTLDVIDRNLETPEIRTASVVDNTADLPIPVRHVPYGNNYHMDIHGMDGRYVYSESLSADPEADYMTFDEEDNAYLTFTVPAYRLTDGENYWIDCYVDGALPGMFGSNNSRMILVVNQDDEGNPNIDTNIGIFVNKTHVAVNEQFTVEVNAPGAKAIRIRFGDQWRAYAGSSVRDQFSEYQPYDEVLYAQACYDELDLPEDLRWYDWDQVAWGRPSQAYEMSFYARGQANEPWFDAPDTVRRGEILTIRHIGLDETANEAHANILWNNPDDGFENWVFGDWQTWNENTREIHLSTNNLDAGRTYWLAVDCSGIGYTGNRRWHTFTVTGDGEQHELFVFDAPETVMLGEPLPVNVYAPDAWRIGFATDGVRWDLDEAGNYHWGYDMNWWTDTENVRWDNPEDAGEHTITAYVKYGDQEEELSLSRTVTVIDPNLEPPEIRADDVVSNTGALDITVPLVPNGTNYHLAIHIVNRNDEESYKYNADLEDGDAVDGLLTFTVPAGTLEDGGYWIDCYVDTYMAGYRRSENHKAILVRNDANNKDSRIHISVDSEQLINQEFPVNISAAGAKAFLVHCGDQSWGCLADEEGNAEIRVTEYQAATEVLYAQACYSDDPNLPQGFQWNFDWENSGIAWGHPSAETVQMRFISYGPAGQAYFDAPITIRRGDVLTVSNIDLGDGANEAHANINENGPGQEERQVYGYGWHGWDERSRTIYMSTSMLEAGRTYWLMVDNSGVGRENSRTWHEFAVTERDEQGENNVFFSVPEKVQTGCIVPINVYAPGAIRTGFGFNLDAEEKTNESKYELMMDGDIAYNLTNFRWDETGEITITAYALFDGQTVPVTFDRTVTICGPLNFDLSGLPGYLEEGQENATVVIPLPENAEGMSVYIHADWDGGRETLYRGDNLTGESSFTIPSEWLTANNQIRVDWSAYAEGFEEVYGGTYIHITSAAGIGATVTLIDENGAAGDLDNIQTNQEIYFRVSPAEGHILTAVRFYDGHGYWWDGEEINHENYDDWFEDDGSLIFLCNYNHNDEPYLLLSVFAEVRVDGSEAWQTTNCLRFTVKTAHGETGEYDFTDLTPITAVRGEVIEVEFTPVSYPEGDIHYWADVFSPNGQSFNPQTNWNGTTVWISTVNLPAGEYVIRGRAVKDTEPGWRWSESRSERALTITEEIPELPDAQFKTPAGLTEIEEEAFVGIAAQTVEIGENVQWIGRRAFADSSVKQVIIRNGGTQIDDSAFEGCGIITVYGQPGSRVQWWAEWNLYTFYPIP